MSKQELFNYFMSVPNPDKNGQQKREKNFKKNYPDLYEEFLRFNFFEDLENKPFIQKLFHFLQDDHGSLGLCKECGKRCTFKYFGINGYSKFCSNKCANKNEECINARKETCISNHGGYGFAAKDISDKFKKTMKKMHGAEYSGWCKEIQNKIIKSNITHNGGIGFASEKVRTKFNKTMKITYGVEWTNQSKEIIHKKRKNKVEQRDDLLEIKDTTYIVKCPHQECSICKEKYFEINKNTYATRLNRDHETCIILNPITNHKSIDENNLFEYVFSIYDGNIIRNDRTCLNGKEIDILLPELNLGIEFNGDYWHMNPKLYNSNDIFINKTAKEIWKKDSLKIELAKNNNIDLIIIWEYDWNNNQESVKKLIKDIIINKLNS